MGRQQERFEEGLEVQARLLGEKGAAMLREASARGYRTRGMQDFVEISIAHGMVDMWSRPGLDMRSRSVAQIGSLMGMRQWDELGEHIRYGLRNGLTPDEIMEIILQVSVYGGQAMGRQALGVAGRIFKESGIDERKPTP
jgi:alkylhydroperoxidase/carboxymuconolactone decarboxylase family protein YurZ